MIAIFASLAAYAIIVKDHLGTPYDSLFDLHGSEYGVDPNLLRAIGRTESGFANVVSKPNANGTRDFGVMQINERNFAVLGLNQTTALDPKRNIAAAAKFLAMLRRELGDRDSIFARISSYNVGTPTFLRSGIVNDPYVSRVYWHFTRYQLARLFQ